MFLPGVTQVFSLREIDNCLLTFRNLNYELMKSEAAITQSDHNVMPRYAGFI